jgi:hypothetical protein
LLRTFSTAFVQAVIFAAAPLCLRCLSAAELLDCVPPGSGGCNALLPKLVDWRRYNRQMSLRAVSMFTSRRMSAPPRSVRRPWQIGHTAGEISAAPQVVAVAAQLQGWIGMGYSGSMSDHFRECGEGRATVSLGRAPTAPAALVHRREPCRSRALPGDPRLLRFSRRKESNEVGDE